MSLNEALQELCGALPRWVIALRGLRRREGLTQLEMGKILRIHQSNLSQMEHGKRPIAKVLAKKLANFFKTDYRLFL
jgi:transcriptional regulator with XRE-family HTH domain